MVFVTSWCLLFVIVIFNGVCHVKGNGCQYPGHGLHSHTNMTQSTVAPNTKVKYSCDVGYELFGNATRICKADGTWSGKEPVCATNIARHRLVTEVSSFIDQDDSQRRQKILDEYYSSCSIARHAKLVHSTWTIDLLQVQEFSLIHVIFGDTPEDLDFAVYYGNSSDSRTIVPFDFNEPPPMHPVTVEFEMVVREIDAYDLQLQHPVYGRYLTIKVLPSTRSDEFSLCEVAVFSSSASTAEQCQHSLFETFPTAVLEDTCYSFHRGQRLRWLDARTRCGILNGSLVTGVTVASQEFLRISLRKQLDPATDDDVFWVGSRERKDFDEVGVIPLRIWLNDTTRKYYVATNTSGLMDSADNCLVISGPLGWKWTVKNCYALYSWICQYGIPNCGSPDQHAETEMQIDRKTLGGKTHYSCLNGHALFGAVTRTCLHTGHWSDEAPTCGFVDCGYPEKIDNGTVVLIQGTTTYGSVAEYSCKSPSSHLVGPSSRVCERDGKWSEEIPVCAESIPSAERQIAVLQLEIVLGVAFGCLLLLMLVTLLIFLIIYTKNRRQKHYIREYEHPKNMLARFDSDDSIVTNGGPIKESNLLYAYENGKANGKV